MLLKVPIDKEEVDERFKEQARYKTVRKQWQIAADVAFIKDSKLRGLGEIYTLDEIHGCRPSKEMSGFWLTPYHKFHHTIQHGKDKLEFLTIVNVFPKTLEREKLPWEDARKHSVEEWITLWKSLLGELREKGVRVGQIMICEDGAERIE